MTGMTDNDLTGDLQAAVRDAQAQGEPLRIRAGGTKAFYGYPVQAERELDMRGHSGVIAHEPTELFITARAGTPLSAIESLLDEHGQQLPFEPPHFGPTATFGGAVATGLSGPRRAYAGSVRDAVLGARILNGRGEDLHFGGQVMKNVAGYDLSRLMVGAQGTLGVLLEITVKLRPRPPRHLTLRHEVSARQALELMTHWAHLPVTITATCHDGEALYVRLCGGDIALESAQAVIQGDAVDEAEGLWDSIREHRHDFFDDPRPLWRLSVPPATAPIDLPGEQLIEWDGGLRWLKSDADSTEIRRRVSALGGHATLFRGGARNGDIFHPLAPALMKYHQRVKQSLDPAGILNPGRMYRGF